MHPVGIIVIILVSIYMLIMLVYFINRLINGQGLVDECDQCKNKGKRLLKFYYKQKRKEEKKLNL